MKPSRETNDYWDALDRHELGAVRAIAAVSRRPLLGSCCRWINWFGNGWLYLAAVGVEVAVDGTGAWRPIVAAGVSAGLAFLPYLLLKPSLARIRPCDVDPSLHRGVRPLDRFSCPSGHCMTIAAVGVPLVWVHPQWKPVILAIATLMAWAQLSLGQHYPSDIVIGTVFGVVSGLTICFVFL